MPAPAGATIEVQGFDASTQQPFTCGSAKSTANPNGDSSTSVVTISVSAMCAKSSFPPRVLINGQVATTFDYKVGVANLDLGQLRVVSPEQNTTAPNPGGMTAGLPDTGGETIRRGRSEWYLYAALMLFGAAGLALAGPLVRRIIRRR
ncbi:MAG: hypothetical protein ACYDCT_06565 [Dehalococcoidia bacterium]